MSANINNFKPIKRFVRLASVTCVAIAIYGCSSVDTNDEKELAMTPEQQLYMMGKIENWSAIDLDSDPLEKETPDKPEIMKSNTNPSAVVSNSALDNSTLSNSTLDNSTFSNTDNNIDEGKISEPVNNQQQTGASAKKGSHVKASFRSLGHNFPKVGIHIAMFKDVKMAPIGWQYLQTILPTNIINKTPLLEQINYQNTEYYSLRLGPFKSANSAKQMCVNLHQQQHYCSVVEYKGALLN